MCCAACCGRHAKKCPRKLYLSLHAGTDDELELQLSIRKAQRAHDELELGTAAHPPQRTMSREDVSHAHSLGFALSESPPATRERMIAIAKQHQDAVAAWDRCPY